MRISRHDLRRIFRDISNEDYLTLDNTDGNRLTKKDYFKNMWDFLNKEFTFRICHEAFLIEYKKDRESNLKFLWMFIILNSNIDMGFNISNKEEKAQIFIFKKYLNNSNLRAIMKLLYEITCFKNQDDNYFLNK